MANFDLIVFDWDGTLMDSADIIVSSIRAAGVDAGFPPVETERARHVIGLALMEALSQVFPAADEERLDYLGERYRHHYFAYGEEMKLFSGVANALKSLNEAGHLLAVATGKSRRGLDSALASSGVGDYFHGSRCADECFSKPHPAMLLELMEEFGVDKARTLMIGDTTHDLRMAQNAGVKSVGVAYGAHPRRNLEELSPLACCGDFSELNAWLQINA